MLNSSNPSVDMARRKELRNEWYRLSDRMMTTLRDAVMRCSELTEEQRMKWKISTTHDEVCVSVCVLLELVPDKRYQWPCPL